MTIEDTPTSEELLHVDPEVMNPTPDEVALGALLHVTRPIPGDGRRGPNKRRAQEDDDTPWGGGELGWRSMAECTEEDASLFFSDNKKDQAKAINFCSECVVRKACLDYALESNQKFGIWGGVDEKGRSKLRRRWQAELRKARANERKD